MPVPGTSAGFDWYFNKATGELARPREFTDSHLAVDLWLQPGAAVAGAHTHDNIDETSRS